MKIIYKVRLSIVILLGFFCSICAFSVNPLGIPGGEHSSIGIYIKDIVADTMVYSSDAERNHVPASITKAITSASAMSLLKQDFCFETKVYTTGQIGNNGTLQGNLVIKASGDPTLESEHFPKYQGFISEIIDALQNKGINKIEGDVIQARVDENHQYEEGPISTWNIDDVCYKYGCGIFDFNWCDNYIGLYPATGKTTSPVPELKYSVWENPWPHGADFIRGVYSDSLIISGKKYATDSKARINTTMPYPFNVFRAKLIERLRNADIEISGKKSMENDRSLLISHRSPKLDEILRSLMHRSDNMFAEGMLRVLGDQYGNLSESLGRERNLWKSRGIHAEYTRILDGSGLSRGDSFSPSFIGEVLEYMAKSGMSRRYVSLFPIAGYEGTMKSFLSDTKLKGRVAMKTGSFNGVQCYAGYMKDSDGNPTHVIVVMANNFYCTRDALKAAISKMLVNKLSPWI